MADHSLIEWTDATWNPITGCSVISPGCTNCYAMKLAGTRLKHHPSRAGLTVETKAGPVWTGEVRLNEDWLDQPLRWSRPRRIFVCAHGDLFHEAVPDAWIDDIVIVMALARQHTFQVLTKRARRMGQYFSDPALFARLSRRALEGFAAIIGHPRVVTFLFDHPDRVARPLPNVWLGVSAEDQPRADERIPELLATPAAVRFLSAEPLIAPVDLAWALARNSLEIARGFLRRGHFSPGLETLRPLDLVIAGGENGDRPMHPDWVRQIRDDCANAGVAFFFKQWGSYAEHEAGEPNREVYTDSDEADAILADQGDRCVWVHRGGGVFRSVLDLPEEEPCRLMLRVGKTAAGRVLDGRTHDEMPEPRHG